MNYRGVRKGRKGKWVMRTSVNGIETRTLHDTEREAAISYDMAQIRSGKQPKNILKKVEHEKTTSSN